MIILGWRRRYRRPKAIYQWIGEALNEHAARRFSWSAAIITRALRSRPVIKIVEDKRHSVRVCGNSQCRTPMRGVGSVIHRHRYFTTNLSLPRVGANRIRMRAYSGCVPCGGAHGKTLQQASLSLPMSGHNVITSECLHKGHVSGRFWTAP